jgi:hypothetical protein
MASPVVAGVGALLLEKCPSMNQAEYMNHITSSAYIDNFTGTNLPNNAFGYGKLDGFAAVVSSNFLPSHIGSTEFCNGDSTSIVILSNYESVLWESGSTNFSQVFSIEDTTFVFATDSSGCLSDTLHLMTTERDKPLIDQFFAPFYHCEGDSSEVQLTGINLDNANWEDGYLGLNHYVQGTHNYFVIGSDIEGCLSDTAWISIIENALPNTPTIYYLYDSLIAENGYNNYSWEYNGSPITSTGTDSVLVVNLNGNYTVTVTDINGCENTSAPFTYNSVGINKETNNIITVYPNPTIGLLTVLGHSNTTMAVITDVSGKILKSFELKNNISSLDISNLPNGIYFVRLQSAENHFVQKIVLNK